MSGNLLKAPRIYLSIYLSIFVRYFILCFHIRTCNKQYFRSLADIFHIKKTSYDNKYDNLFLFVFDVFNVCK